MRKVISRGIWAGLLVSVLLAGCAQPNPLIGKWEATVLGTQLTTLEFTKDGEVIADSSLVKFAGTYKLEDKDKVRIVWSGENGSVFKYTIAGDSLTISLFGTPMTYQRMKAKPEQAKK